MCDDFSLLVWVLFLLVCVIIFLYFCGFLLVCLVMTSLYMCGFVCEYIQIIFMLKLFSAFSISLFSNSTHTLKTRRTYTYKC